MVSNDMSYGMAFVSKIWFSLSKSNNFFFFFKEVKVSVGFFIIYINKRLC